MTLAVTHEELGTASWTLDLAGLPRPIQLRLEPWTELKGQVADAEGRGVASALIAVSGGAGGFNDMSDGDGCFRFRMAAGEYDIVVDSPRAGAARLHGVRLPLEDPAQPLRISLGGDDAIRGRVLVPGGEPVGDLEVLLRRMPDDDEIHHDARPFVRGSVDAGGWFSVPVDDGEYTVQVVAGNSFFGEPVEGVRAGGPALEIRLKSVARRRVTGRVVDGGVPVQGARLWRQAVSDVRPRRMPQDTAETVTDADGAFELALGGADDFVILAQAPGFVYACSPLLRGGNEENIDDVVIAPRQGADLELRIKDAAGKPVAGAIVKLTGVTEPRIHARAVADESGGCILKRVPPGDHKLGAVRRKEPRTGKTVLWDFGMEPVELTIDED